MKIQLENDNKDNKPSGNDLIVVIFFVIVVALVVLVSAAAGFDSFHQQHSVIINSGN